MLAGYRSTRGLGGPIRLSVLAPISESSSQFTTRQAYDSDTLLGSQHETWTVARTSRRCCLLMYNCRAATGSNLSSIHVFESEESTDLEAARRKLLDYRFPRVFPLQLHAMIHMRADTAGRFMWQHLLWTLSGFTMVSASQYTETIIFTRPGSCPRGSRPSRAGSSGTLRPSVGRIRDLESLVRVLLGDREPLFRPLVLRVATRSRKGME